MSRASDAGCTRCMKRNLLSLPPAPPDKRVRFGDDPNQFFDLWEPANARAVAIMIHGGFWRAKYDLSTRSHLCAALAKNGLAVANLEYRRVGQCRWRLARHLRRHSSGIRGCAPALSSPQNNFCPPRPLRRRSSRATTRDRRTRTRRNRCPRSSGSPANRLRLAPQPRCGRRTSLEARPPRSRKSTKTPAPRDIPRSCEESSSMEQRMPMCLPASVRSSEEARAVPITGVVRRSHPRRRGPLRPDRSSIAARGQP